MRLSGSETDIDSSTANTSIDGTTVRHSSFIRPDSRFTRSNLIVRAVMIHTVIPTRAVRPTMLSIAASETNHTVILKARKMTAAMKMSFSNDLLNNRPNNPMTCTKRYVDLRKMNDSPRSENRDCCQ